MLRWLALLGLCVVILVATDAGFSTYLILFLAWYAAWTAAASRAASKDVSERLGALQRELREALQKLKSEAAVIEKKESAAAAALSAPATVPPGAPVLPRPAVPAVAATPASALSAPPAPAQPAAIAPNVTSAAPLASPPPPPISAPRFAQVGISSPVADLFDRSTGNIKSNLDFEVLLGTNWLSKLGIFILVLGVAFFLTWELRELGPAGKDVVGFVVSACLLGVGIGESARNAIACWRGQRSPVAGRCCSLPPMRCIT